MLQAIPGRSKVHMYTRFGKEYFKGVYYSRFSVVQGGYKLDGETR